MEDKSSSREERKVCSRQKEQQSQRHRGKADLREADGARVWKGGRGDTGRGMARTSKVSGPLMQALGS